MRQWYEELFANNGVAYDRESFTNGTEGECDFVEAELDYQHSRRILDIGCGTGRHSIELCKRGYDITGIDLSSALISRAKDKAKSLNLKIDFRVMDARNLSFDTEFDLAIMICEGAFPLMETDEMNFEILKGAFRALKYGGKFIFTTLNGLFPIHHSTSDFCNHDTGDSSYHNSRFDLMTFRDHSLIRSIDDNGNIIELECNERYYIPSEITWMLKSLGFENINISAAKLGQFSKSHPLESEDYEMLVTCSKSHN